MIRRALVGMVIAIGTAAAADLSQGLSLMREGKYDEAAPVLEKVVAENGDSAEARLALAQVYVHKQQFDRAEEQLKTKPVQECTLPAKPFVRGAVAVSKKKYSDALPDLEEVLEKDPENAYAYYYAGLAYANTRRPDKMVGAFNNFLRLKPDAPEAAKVRSFLHVSR